MTARSRGHHVQFTTTGDLCNIYLEHPRSLRNQIVCEIGNTQFLNFGLLQMSIRILRSILQRYTCIILKLFLGKRFHFYVNFQLIGMFLNSSLNPRHYQQTTGLIIKMCQLTLQLLIPSKP